MLDLIRSNTQSFGVKLAFGIIILVFVFWGIGSITDTGTVNVVGMVNDQPITFQQYETAYRNAEENATRNNPGRQWSSQEKSQLGHQVFNSLVTDALLEQEAVKNNISVAPYELRLYVDKIPAFKNEKGKFDPEVYKNVLSQQRQTPAQFEQMLRSQLLREKLVRFVMGGMWSDSMEPRNRFNYLRQQRTVEYVFISDKEARNVPDPTEAEITGYYDAHKNLFAIPHKVDAEYIAVNPSNLVKPEDITPEQARKWYDSHISSYEEPRRVQVSHILVPVAANASDAEVKKAEQDIVAIRKELDTKPFAAVADAHNAPQAAGKGGDIGWIESGMTVPEFEKAAFSAEKGKVTGPVRTQFGLHLLVVTDTKEGGTKSFESVEKDIRTTLAQDEGKAKINEVLDTLIEENILGKPLKESASKAGLSVAESGLVAEQELIQKLKIKQDAATTIMNTAASHPVDVPVEAENSYLIVRVKESTPASFSSLADVRGKVVDAIRKEKGTESGRVALQELLKKVGDGSMPADWASKVKMASPMGRDGAMAPFEAQHELAEAVFAAPINNWIGTVFPVATKDDAGVAICRVVKLQDPDDKEWQQFEQIMTGLMERERTDGVYQAFIQELVSRSKITVMNQDAIDRTNM